MPDRFTTDNKQPIEKYLMPFGKYKGEYVSDVVSEAPDYIEWLLKQTPNAELVAAIEHAQQ